MKIAVTGASGHIGANLCRRLLEKGHNVRALIHRNQASLEGLPLEHQRGDITDTGSLASLCRDRDIVFHLAAVISIQGAKNEAALQRNIEGVGNIVEAVRRGGAKRLIHFSSIHALDPRPYDQVLDEDRPLALDDRVRYSRTKALAEKAVLDFVRVGGDAVILNPTSVVGPVDFYPSLIGRALILLYRGKIPALVTGGYDWVDVRDVVEAAIAAMDSGRRGERYLLSGHWRSLKDVAGAVAATAGRRTVPRSCPHMLARWALPVLNLYFRAMGSVPLYTKDSLEILRHGHTLISSEKAQRELGYTTREFETTISDSIAWFKDQGFID